MNHGASGPSVARFRGCVECVESGADAGIALGKEHSVRANLLPEELLVDLRHRGSRAGEQTVLRVMADGDDDDGDACLQHVLYMRTRPAPAPPGGSEDAVPGPMS